MLTIAESYSAVAFSAEFGTGQWVTASLASLQAGFGSEIANDGRILLVGKRTPLNSFSVATKGLVIGDGGAVHNWEGRIRVDVKTIKSTTGHYL